MTPPRREWLDGLKLDDEVIIIQTRPGRNENMIGHVDKILKHHIVVVTIVGLKVPSWKVHKLDGHEVHRPGMYFGVYIEEPTDELRKGIRIAKKMNTINERCQKILRELPKREQWKEEDLDKIIKMLDDIGI